jgi:hypothetical protein
MTKAWTMDLRGSLGSCITQLVVLGFAVSLGSLASAQRPDPDPQTLAHEAYVAGVAAFQHGDHEQARLHFMAADEAFSSPNVKLMLGRTLIQLERRVEAHASLMDAISEARSGSGARYEQTASTATEELRQLEQKLAIISLRIDDPTGSASLHVGEREIAREAWEEPIVAEPGAIEIALVGPEGQRDVKQLAMTGGSAATLAMLIPEHAPVPVAEAPTLPVITASNAGTGSSSRSSGLRPLGYAAIGVGAVGIVAFGVLGALSNAQFAKLDAACPDRAQCGANLREHATLGQTYQTLANVSLGVGVAALAAGIVLWVIGLPSEHDRPTLTARGAQLSGAF